MRRRVSFFFARARLFPHLLRLSPAGDEGKCQRERNGERGARGKRIPKPKRSLIFSQIPGTEFEEICCICCGKYVGTGESSSHGIKSNRQAKERAGASLDCSTVQFRWRH